MTKQEIAKEKETLSYMILDNIQERRDLNQLASLLARRTRLSSEIKEENEEHASERFSIAQRLLQCR